MAAMTGEPRELEYAALSRVCSCELRYLAGELDCSTPWGIPGGLSKEREPPPGGGNPEFEYRNSKRSEREPQMNAEECRSDQNEMSELTERVIRCAFTVKQHAGMRISGEGV